MPRGTPFQSLGVPPEQGLGPVGPARRSTDVLQLPLPQTPLTVALLGPGLPPRLRPMTAVPLEPGLLPPRRESWRPGSRLESTSSLEPSWWVGWSLPGLCYLGRSQ